MNDILTPDQIADLAGIRQICNELGADLVVIGATSLLILMGDLGLKDAFLRKSSSDGPLCWLRCFIS